MNSIINGVDYGPLAQLIGKWIGNKGLDNAPDANANPDKTFFTDEMVFTASGPAENAEEQNLVSTIKNENLIGKFNEINKPPNIHYQVIESYLQAISMVEYLINDNRHDLVNSSLGTFKFCIDSMRRSTNSYIFFE